jgi:nitrogen regulatory protein P-II 1
MKHLILMVHGNVQQELADRLHSLKQVQGFTFTHVEGRGTHVAHDPFQSARDQVVGYVPRIQVEVLLEDGDVATVLATLRGEDNSLTGQGIYWVTPVEQHGRL